MSGPSACPDSESAVSFFAMGPARKLLHPSTLILIAANALPLLGVLFWQWDVFLLLVLYWMETAIIGFWTIVAIALIPHQVIGPKADTTSRAFLIPFFAAHSGIFMSVHFMFLWALFSGTWTASVNGPASFLQRIVLDTGLWVPLLALFFARGVSCFLMAANPGILPRWLAPLTPKQSLDNDPFSDKRLLGGYYTRIVVMHLTILFGALIASMFGTIAPLVLMIALKIAIDLRLHLKNDLAEPKAVTAPAA